MFYKARFWSVNEKNCPWLLSTWNYTYLSRVHKSALPRLLSLVSVNRYSPSIPCLLQASSVIQISRKEADFSIMGKGFRKCLFVNITGYRLNMLWFWDKRLLLLSLNFISLCLAPSITHSAFSVFFAPVFSDKSRSVYHCVSPQLTKTGLTLGGGGGGMEAEHNFFWMPLLHSNNPKRELLECSPYSACHQKILGLNTHHRQLRKMNEAAKIHGYSLKPFQSRQIWYLLSVQEKKGSRGLCVWEGEGCQGEGCRKPGSTTGSPRYLPRGDCYCQRGHWGLNAAASWAALNRCTSARKKKGFHILLFSRRFQNKAEISVEVNDAKRIRKFWPD